MTLASDLIESVILSEQPKSKLGKQLYAIWQKNGKKFNGKKLSSDTSREDISDENWIFTDESDAKDFLDAVNKESIKAIGSAFPKSGKPNLSNSVSNRKAKGDWLVFVSEAVTFSR